MSHFFFWRICLKSLSSFLFPFCYFDIALIKSIAVVHALLKKHHISTFSHFSIDAALATWSLAVKVTTNNQSSPGSPKFNFEICPVCSNQNITWLIWTSLYDNYNPVRINSVAIPKCICLSWRKQFVVSWWLVFQFATDYN